MSIFNENGERGLFHQWVVMSFIDRDDYQQHLSFKNHKATKNCVLTLKSFKVFILNICVRILDASFMLCYSVFSRVTYKQVHKTKAKHIQIREVLSTYYVQTAYYILDPLERNRVMEPINANTFS